MLVKEKDVTIPLQLDGTISYFNSHLPTRHKFETCCHIELTSQEQWDPKAEDIAQEEQKYMEHQEGNPEERQINAVSRISVVDTVLEDIDPMLSDICMLETMCRISAVSTDDKRGPISSQRLSRIWGIGLDTAKNTLSATTQSIIRQGVHPLERRYRTAHKQYRYNTLNDRFYSDVMFAGHKSLSGNTCATVFVNGGRFSFVHPMTNKSYTHEALADFYDTVGVPRHLHTDGGGEFTSKKWKRAKGSGGICKQTLTEPHSSWQNAAEMEIGELKKQVRRIMRRARCSPRLWDYCLVYVSEIRSRMAFSSRHSKRRTGYEVVTGNTPDISEWAEFEFYQLVFYYYQQTPFPEDKKKLAR